MSRKTMIVTWLKLEGVRDDLKQQLLITLTVGYHSCNFFDVVV